MNTVTYREYITELRRIEEEFKNQTLVEGITDRIRFYNTGDENIQMELNISATGRITPIEAERFAYCIEVAAKLLQEFKYNGYKITYPKGD